MGENDSTFSVVIPLPPDSSADKTVQGLRNISFPKDKFEIILSYGKAPSHQRNEAVKKAEGQILYFLDSDSEVHPELFRIIENSFSKSEAVAAVGGPNLTPEDDSWFQKAAGCALGSFFAHMQMSSRYRQKGKMRETTEKELILCNLAVKKSIFDKLGGFNESLYPNEENLFLNELSKSGRKLIYHSDAIVYRSRRPNIFAFFKQFLNYGRGRMEQAWLEKRKGDIFFFIPLFFIIYLTSLFFYRSAIYLVPFYLYLLGAFSSSLMFSAKEKKPLFFLFLPFLYLIMHLGYSCGLLWGLFRIKRPLISNAKVEVVKLKPFTQVSF